MKKAGTCDGRPIRTCAETAAISTRDDVEMRRYNFTGTAAQRVMPRQLNNWDRKHLISQSHVHQRSTPRPANAFSRVPDLL